MINGNKMVVKCWNVGCSSVYKNNPDICPQFSTPKVLTYREE